MLEVIFIVKLNKMLYTTRLTDKYLSNILQIVCSQCLNLNIEKLVRENSYATKFPGKQINYFYKYI